MQSLGAALGPLLVQLPPNLRHEVASAEPFFETLRARFGGDVVCEPRHASWFTEAAGTMLSAFRIARVAADPAPVPGAAEPGGWPGIAYRRLHGSPKMYASPYSQTELDKTAKAMLATARRGRQSWCIFDNTMLGHACDDAMSLARRLSRRSLP